MFQLNIQPQGLTLNVEGTVNLRQLLNQSGVLLSYPCGGKGVCGKCKVQFTVGAPPVIAPEEKLLTQDELAQGMRLACMHQLESAAEIVIPKESQLRAGVSLYELMQSRSVSRAPMIRRIVFSLPKTSLSSYGWSRTELIQQALKEKGVETPSFAPQVLQKIPQVLQATSLEAIVCDGEIIELRTPQERPLWAMAIDLGTTNLAVAFLNLEQEEEITFSTLNPQLIYGADVISRVNVIFQHPERLREMQQLVIQTINNLSTRAQSLTHFDPENLLLLVVAGNSVMEHILLGVDPASLSLAPYAPIFKDATVLKARELGIIAHPEARLFTMPLIGGFVGGDIVADMLASEFPKGATPALLVDIGTNGEVVLTNGERSVATSAAAGPAFEGSQIAYGVRAVPGAIADFSLKAGQIVLDTIGELEPIGICGSGLLALVAELRRLHMIDESGLIYSAELIRDSQVKSRLGRRIKRDNGSRKLLLYEQPETARQIFLTQKDVRAFQLAKGALATAMKMLLMELNQRPEELQRIILCGAFGRYLKPKSAQELGLLPSVALEKIEIWGNGSLAGARLCALNGQLLKQSLHDAEQVEFLELAGRADFQERFIASLELNPFTPSAKEKGTASP